MFNVNKNHLKKTWLKVRFGYFRLYAILKSNTDIVGKVKKSIPVQGNQQNTKFQSI